jgi:hypothetical protein
VRIKGLFDFIPSHPVPVLLRISNIAALNLVFPGDWILGCYGLFVDLLLSN